MEEETLDIIKKIQEARSPKYFLWNIIKDLEWFASERYTDYLIGKKGDIIYLNYDKENHILYYDFYEIYEILESKYHLNELEANKLVSGMVSEHFKLKVDTTYRESFFTIS
jgi:signal peptidase I